MHVLTPNANTSGLASDLAGVGWYGNAGINAEAGIATGLTGTGSQFTITIYYCAGITTGLTVTGLNSLFFAKFQCRLLALKMKNTTLFSLTLAYSF